MIDNNHPDIQSWTIDAINFRESSSAVLVCRPWDNGKELSMPSEGTIQWLNHKVINWKGFQLLLKTICIKLKHLFIICPETALKNGKCFEKTVHWGKHYAINGTCMQHSLGLNIIMWYTIYCQSISCLRPSSDAELFMSRT